VTSSYFDNVTGLTNYTVASTCTLGVVVLRVLCLYCVHLPGPQCPPSHWQLTLMHQLLCMLCGWQTSYVKADLPSCGPFEARPTLTRPCILPCDNSTQYLVDTFGSCSVLCGGGVQTRDVQCVNVTTNTYLPLDKCRPPTPEL
jgi:hypothetical protein